jgi:Domain of unknown function (DUF4249)
MKFIILFLTIFILLITNACEQNIVLPIHDYKAQLSVECILEPGNVPILYLGNTVSYFDTLNTSRDLFVDNAIIIISTSTTKDTLKTHNKYNYYTCQEEFFYQGAIPIVQGQFYHLKIEHNGTIYEADTETNVQAVEIDSISYVENFSDFYGEHEGVVITFTDNFGAQNYYRYRMDRVLTQSQKDILNCSSGSYAATEVGRSVYFDTNVDGTSLTIIIEPAFKHQAGDTAQIYLQTLDAPTARFFDDLDKQKSAKLNPFIEPIFITSNFSSAFGIFGASNYSKAVKFTYPD